MRSPIKAWCALLAPVALLAAAPFAPAPSARQAPAASIARSYTLSLSLLGHTIGTESGTLADNGSGTLLTSHFEYVDRGAKIPLETTLRVGKDFTPLSFESHGKSYRYFSVNASVPHASGAPATFTLDGMAPIGAQALLIRYWLRHGEPATITLEPSGDRIAIRNAKSSWPDTHARAYTIDGVVWGRERVWLANDDHVIAAISSAGVLPFAAVDPALGVDMTALVRAAVADRLAEAQTDLRATPLNHGTFALVGGRLIDATGAAPVEDSVVLVRDGRIAAAGPRDRVAIPRGVAQVNVAGKSVLPGLWDAHAHVGQIEWGPVYLAAGVTSIRDMGGEFDILTALRKAWSDPAAIGPHMANAGLVDGPGPNAFGGVTAAGPEEGRAAVEKYKAAGFEQMKIYSLLERPTVQAVIDAAHADGMTVTGHIPNGLTLRDVVTMGFDNVAHLVVRGTPGSDELRDTIAFVKAHHTVMDPTMSWNELLGRSAQTTVASLLPRVAHVDPSLHRLIESANGGTVTPEQAHERLARSLQIVKALSDAGVPIVAGTDKGVPGVSVAREIELYVEAGLSPIDAIRTATAVPAQVVGAAGDRGTIAPGLRADLIVVDGNPLARISDIEHVTLVCRDGRLYDAPSLWRLGGFH